MKRTLLFPTILLLLVGFGCFFLSASAASRRGAIVFCEAGQIHTLDPQRMTWMQDIRVALGLWEGLTQYNPKTLEPMPGIAEKWTLSPDGRTYHFYLRSGARWSNGDPVTAQNFVFSWRRMLHPSTAGGYVALYFHLAGARAYFYSLVHHPRHHLAFSTVGVQARGPHELVVHLTRPCGYFLSLMAFPPFFPLDAGSMQRFLTHTGGFVHYNARWTRPPWLVTDGPYYLADWRFHEYLLLKPNPYYYDRTAVHCRRLLVENYPDAQSAFLAYQSGTVNVLSFIPGNFAPALLHLEAAGARHDVHYRPVFGTWFMDINCLRPPLNDRRVRQALAMAINKQAIVEDVLRLPERPVNVLVPPDSIPGYRSPAGIGYNPAAARKLLRQAGFPGGRGLRRLKFLIIGGGQTAEARIAQAVAHMWQKRLGIRTRIVQEESKIFHEDTVNHNFDVDLSGWYGDYRDPTTWLNLFRASNPNNHTGLNSRRYEALMREASRTVDPQNRLAVLSAAEKLLVSDLIPAIPLYQASDGYMYNRNRIGGIRPNVQLITLFKYIHWRNHSGAAGAVR